MKKENTQNNAEHLKGFFIVTALFSALLCVLFYWAPVLGIQEDLAKSFVTFRYPVLSRTTSLLMGFLCAANTVAVINIHGTSPLSSPPPLFLLVSIF